MYQCKACGAPATIKADQLMRTCDCNTTVIASMSAVAHGHGSTGERSQTAVLFAKLHELGREFLSGRV